MSLQGSPQPHNFHEMCTIIFQLLHLPARGERLRRCPGVRPGTGDVPGDLVRAERPWPGDSGGERPRLERLGTGDERRLRSGEKLRPRLVKSHYICQHYLIADWNCQARKPTLQLNTSFEKERHFECIIKISVHVEQTYPLRSRSLLCLRSFSPLSRKEESRPSVLPLFFFTSFTRIVLPPSI